MSSIAEIEKAIEKLPAPQVEELAGWLETCPVQNGPLNRLIATFAGPGARRCTSDVNTAQGMASLLRLKT